MLAAANIDQRIQGERAPSGGRAQGGAAVAGMAVLVAIGVAATPFAAMKLRPVPGYMAAFGSSMIVINILLSALLFSKGAIQKRGDATRLGTAYLFVAAVFVPLIACFPDAILPGTLLGTPLSAVWLWTFWHAGFGLWIVRHAWMAGRSASRPASLRAAPIAVACAVAAATIVSTSLLPYLPVVLADGHTLFPGASGMIPVAILSVLAVALVLVWRLPAQTPEQRWLAVGLVAAVFDVWLTWQGAERFSLGWYLSKCGSLFTSLVVLITLLHEVTLLHGRAEAANAVLTGLAHQDGLTGLCNRRRLDEMIALEWRRCAREQQSLSLLMIDVDHFKRFNDLHGHQAGDAVLRRIAEVLDALARRPTDVAARYGGEEFVLLLPATDAAGAIEMAQRLHDRIHLLAIGHRGSTLGQVTVSIGVESLVPNAADAATALVAEADRGLYRAKNNGRDQTRWADERVVPEGAALVASIRKRVLF